MDIDLAPSQRQPELAPPGAGIPAMEALFFRVIGFGLVSPLVSWDLAGRVFRREGRHIIKLLQDLSTERLTGRVLISRITGIEDNSRFWSPAMTVAHLIIVGDAVADFIIRLSGGETIDAPVRIEDVKPDEHTLPGILDEYRAFLPRFGARTTQDVRDRRSTATHTHPWVGPLTAHQWFNLAAVHQRIHRKQIQAILKQGGPAGVIDR